MNTPQTFKPYYSRTEPLPAEGSLHPVKPKLIDLLRGIERYSPSDFSSARMDAQLDGKWVMFSDIEAAIASAA